VTRGTYRQVLLATGLAFCAVPTLGVNPAAATHPVGIVAPADDPAPPVEGDSSADEPDTDEPDTDEMAPSAPPATPETPPAPAPTEADGDQDADEDEADEDAGEGEESPSPLGGVAEQLGGIIGQTPPGSD
jgi:hypothetical protein